MTTEGKPLDALIREALSREEAALFDRLGEPTLPDMMLETFRGRRRWLNVYISLVTFVFFGLAVLSVVRIFQAEEVAEMLRWGVGFGLGLSVSLALKVWFWLEMQRHATSREIKRVELAVAHLAAELRATRTPGDDA
jgi:hypothetical protein